MSIKIKCPKTISIEEFVRLERIKEVYDMAKRMKSTMCFYPNTRFSNFKSPFITEEDVQSGKFIIREREFDKVKWSQNEARFRRCGITKWDCYDSNSTIIKTYYSMKDMARDCWEALS